MLTYIEQGLSRRNLSRILAILLTLTVLTMVAEAEDTETSVSNRLSLFIIEITRKKETLERDFELIGTFLQDAEIGDEIQCITTTGQNVFQYHLAMKKMNPVRARQAQNQAIAELTAFFVRLLKEPPPADTENDVAGAISLGLGRFNAAAPYERMSLIVLSGGLQFDSVIDFRGAYPNGAWIIHELSPFSTIPRNMTKAKVDCLMIPQRLDYVNTHHKTKIRKWYQWLFDHKAVQFIGFTSDHKTASDILTRGAPAPQKPPTPIDLNGELEITEIGRLITSDPGEGK